MQRKEIIRRAIEFTGPPRVPLSYCMRDDFNESDTACVGSGAATSFAPTQPGETEWGYVWESLDRTMGQPDKPPLAEWAHIDTYRPPDPRAPGRFDRLAEQVASVEDRFIKFGLGITGFNQATFLRGFEPFLMDLCMEPARAQRILDLVFSYENALIEQLEGYAIDAVAFADDWGTQQGLMIAPAQWREVFRPRYAEQFDLIHRQGKKVWFHTCGNVWDILGDLIDIGADVLELLQPDVFGVERLAREYGGHACFCCAVDHQRRAITGTRDEIHAYVAQLHRRLGAFNGGFIGYVEDYACLGMDEQHYQWIREAFLAVSNGSHV